MKKPHHRIREIEQNGTSKMSSVEAISSKVVKGRVERGFTVLTCSKSFVVILVYGVMSYRQSLWFYGELLVRLKREGCVLMEKREEREFIVVKSKSHIFSFFWSLSDYWESKTILFSSEGKFATVVCLIGRLMGLEIFLKISHFLHTFLLNVWNTKILGMVSACIRRQFIKNCFCKNFKFPYVVMILWSVYTIRVYFVFSVPCQKYVFDNLAWDGSRRYFRSI